MSGTPLVDEGVFDDLIEQIGRDALAPVIALFLDESRRQTADIVAAATAPDEREVARQAAHSLKSSAGQLGAARLSEEAAAIERAVGAGAPLAELAAALAECATATAAALDDRLRRSEG